MGSRERKTLFYTIRKDARGATLPVALLLLFLTTGALLSSIFSYDAHYRTYDSLESAYVHATMEKIISRK